MFSISFHYVVLAAVCAAVAQGDGSPGADGGFQHYFPRQCAAGGEGQVAPWVHYLQFPTSEPLDSFNQWLLGRALAADVPSLSLAMQWGSKLVMLKGSRGATRDVAKSVLLTTIDVGLSFGRLLLVYRRPCWPMWFRVAWQAVPSGLRNGLMQQDFTYLLEVLSWVQRPPNGTAVYGSQPGSCGLAARCVENLVGLLFVHSRDGSLGRYKVLRQSAASATFLPLQIFTSECRALSVGRLLIDLLAPSANGVDQVTGYIAGTKKQWLRASKAKRWRPPLHVRRSSLQNAFAVAQQERIAEESSQKQGQVLAAALYTMFAESSAAVQKPPETAQGVGASQQQSFSQAQSCTAAPLRPGSAEFQPLNQTQLDQIRNLLSELLEKQPGQAPPLLGRLRGKTKDPAVDGSTDVSPLQKALVASMFGGRVSVDKLDFDTFRTQVLAVWQQRAVPDAVSTFLQTHASGTAIPKAKVARLQLFWKTLVGMS